MSAAALSRRHLAIGWWTLLGFLGLGAALHLLGTFKFPWYVEPAYETRRLMFRLAHTHGTLLGLVHIAWALVLPGRVDASAGGLACWSERSLRWTSRCLTAAVLLFPTGFFLGGLVFWSGDPGPGIFLVPPGALLLLAGVTLAATASVRAGRG